MKIGYKKGEVPTGETVNRAGGKAFEIKNASEKLLTMIGASFFDEPSFYEGMRNQDTRKKPNLEKLSLGFTVNKDAMAALSERSREMIDTAIAVATSDNPRDLLALAHWSRKEMNIRTTPQVLLAVAAAVPQTRPFVKEYATKIIQRADEPRDVFAIYRSFFGGALPHCLKKGLAEAFTKFNETQLMRYDGDERPSFKDVLLMIERGRGYPVSRPLFEYLVNRKITNPESIPVIAARAKFNALEGKKWTKEASNLAKDSNASWENILSKFGQASNKADLWAWLVDSKSLGYMATLRNLRNMVEAGVEEATINKVAAFLSDPERVKESKQLPFRFYAACKAICDNEEMAKVDTLLDAVDTALKASVSTLPALPGVTAVFADNSDSMRSALSAKSEMMIIDAANLMAAIVLQMCDKAILGVFGNTAATVRLSKADRIMTNMSKLANKEVGCSTNAHLVCELLRKGGHKVDRLIVLSDMQCWNSDMYTTGNFADAWRRYKKEVNPDAILHTIDLQGDGLSIEKSKEGKVHLYSGFSEKIYHRIAESEGIGTEDGKALPAVDYVRANY